MNAPRPKDALGKRGEDYARRVLERQGYRFIAANWYCPYGELDIIMMDGEELVFVEVKTRRGNYSGSADEAVTRSKGYKLLKAGDRWVSQHPEHHDRIWRIDLFAITIDPYTEKPTFRHYINAIEFG